MSSKRIASCLVTVLLGMSLGLSATAQNASAKSETVKDVYPGLSSGSLASARLTVLPSGMLLRSGDLKIMQKDVDAAIAGAPAAERTQLKNNAFFVLENSAVEGLLVIEGKAWGKQTGRPADENVDTLMKAYFESLMSKVAVTDDEVKAFFDSNKQMMGDAIFDQVKDQLKSFLLGEKRQEAADAHVATVSDRASVEVSKAWVAKQYASAMNNPVNRARRSGKPTMADFGSEGCQPCELMAPILDALKKEYAGRANIVFVHVQKEQILAARYGIRAIPVQIFYDKAGKEVFRHTGFYSRELIVAKLAEIGAK